jgi:hypothetical protein
MGSESIGPFSRDEIVSGVSVGDFAADMMISRSSQGPWKKLNEELNLTTQAAA